MRLVLAVVLVFFASSALAQTAVPLLPDLQKTPGAIDPAATAAVVCNSAFSTKSARRGSKSDRRCVLDRYGGTPAFAFTYDHLVPLEIGGADSCYNLWPQPRAEAKRKDDLENALQAQVCACHALTLQQAQDAIRTNGLAAYAKFVTPKGSSMCAVNP